MDGMAKKGSGSSGVEGLFTRLPAIPKSMSGVCGQRAGRESFEKAASRGILFWSSGWDSMLPLKQAPVPSSPLLPSLTHNWP